MDLFEKIEIKTSDIICHSGGAPGSDTFWEQISISYGIKVKAYSYKTPLHKSINKVEISDDDFNEGVLEVNKANKWLNRYGINKYMNLLARNWAQVKYSDQIFAIGTIIKPKCRNNKGYYNKGKYEIVDGGTGYAVMMGINHNKEIFVFDQIKLKWFKWSHISMSFIELKEVPKIESLNFAGIGTRQITIAGENAIKDVFKKTFDY